MTARRFTIRGNRILATFFVSFIIATIIPVATLSCVYSITLHTMEEDVISRNTSVIEQCRQAADSVFSLTENVVSALSFDSAARKFASRSYPYSSSLLASCTEDLRRSVDIQRYVMEQANIIELGVYSSMSKAVVSKLAGYARSNSYFGFGLRSANSDILEEMQSADKFMFHPMTNVNLFGKNYNAIFVTSPIISSTGRCISGASAYAILDATKLMEILNDLILSNDCFAFIADSSGSIILQAAGGSAGNYAYVSEINVDPDQYIILSCSDARGYSYTAYVSSDIVYEKVAFIRRIMMFVTIAGLLVGILVSFILALRSSRPVMDIYDIVKSSDASTASAPISYDYLKGTISECVRSNAALSQGMKRYMDYSRRDLIRRLTDGSAFLPNEIDSRARTLGMDLSAKTYAALLVRCPLTTADSGDTADAISDMNNVWLIVEHAFYELDGFSALFSGNYTSEMPILILMDDMDQEHCSICLQNAIEQISQGLRLQFNISLCYICGGFTHDIADVSNLFARAHDCIAADDGALLFAKNDVRADVYYSIQEELHLIKAIQAGECNIAFNLIDHIVERNLSTGAVSPDMLKMFRHALHLTIARSAEGAACRDEILLRAEFLLDDREFISADELPNALRNMVNDIILLNQQASKDRDKERMNQILDSINERFSDPDFTLYSLSEQFGLPESYLYRYIRSQSGSTFAALLERCRMDKAAELLIGSELSVDDIAKQTGYNSSHAFRRVFKKCYGMLPTQYRETDKANIEG